MTREQFAAALVQSPRAGQAGEAVFDFHEVDGAPCPEFRYDTAYEWGDHGEALEECWQAYLEEWETEWID